MSETIAACSSGAMPCAIAIVRLSGEQAMPIADGAFSPMRGAPLSGRDERTLVYGRLTARDGALIDLCLAARFDGEKSYTGEPLVEFYTHGSQAVVAALLEHCYALGAVPAPAGEFTKRAFLAGRMDLTEAEAVADLIHAQSELGAKSAAAQLEGSVGTRIRALREQAVGLLAHFYAVCDYTDEDLDPFDYAHAAQVLEDVTARLRALYQGFQRGRLVREGVPVAIIGRPNAGKSTLFNALAGAEKAIVTDEAGTTRDVLEQVISCGGAPIRILDTAGLRESDSKAERMGVERARAAAQTAQTAPGPSTTRIGRRWRWPRPVPQARWCSTRPISPPPPPCGQRIFCGNTPSRRTLFCPLPADRWIRWRNGCPSLPPRLRRCWSPRQDRRGCCCRRRTTFLPRRRAPAWA